MRRVKILTAANIKCKKHTLMKFQSITVNLMCKEICNPKKTKVIGVVAADAAATAGNKVAVTNA